MPEHQLSPEPVPIDFSRLVSLGEPAVKQVALIQSVIDLANAALSEYGVEIIPSINFEKGN